MTEPPDDPPPDYTKPELVWLARVVGARTTQAAQRIIWSMRIDRVVLALLFILILAAVNQGMKQRGRIEARLAEICEMLRGTACK